MIHEKGTIVKNGLRARPIGYKMTVYTSAGDGRAMTRKVERTKRRAPASKSARGSRRALQDDSSQCAKCTPARCCMYFSIEVDRPETERDFDDFLWMIAHRDVEFYTKRRKWYLMVKTPCRFYDPARGCIIYPSRPRICRLHHPDECEFDEAYDFDLHFRSYDELERYAIKRFHG